MSEPLDDFDLEVSPLARASASVEGDERGASSTPDGEEPNTPPTRHVSVAARRPRTQQRRRAGSAIALLILLATAILFVPTSNRDAFFHMLAAATPLPIATPLAGADVILVGTLRALGTTPDRWQAGSRRARFNDTAGCAWASAESRLSLAAWSPCP